VSTADQASFEEIRLSALREHARRWELEYDRRLAAAIARWEARRGQSFHRYAAEYLTSDAEHPVSESTVYDWISRRNGRRPPACLDEILFADDDDFNAWKNEQAGFEAPRRKLPASGDALARAYEERLRAFGELGEKAIADARATAGRGEPAEWERTTPVRRIP